MAHATVRAAALLWFAIYASASPHGSLGPRAVAPRALPASWTALGCYYDPGSPRVLSQATYTDSTAMTNEACATYCQARNYVYAGMEYSQECYCGNYFTTNTSEPSTDCNMPCTGNSAEVCGGPSRVSIFWNGTKVAAPVIDPGPPGWKFQGCYSEGTNGGRTLTTTVQVPGGGSNMSVQACTTACAGFAYAGTEFSQECYCGNEISNGGANGTISNCNMVCAGNSSEFCGAGGYLNLYAVGSASTSSSVSLSSTKSSTSSSTIISTSSSKISSSSSIKSSSLSSTSSTSTSKPSSTSSSSSTKVSSTSSTSTSTPSSSSTKTSSSTSTSASVSVTAVTGPVHVPTVGAYNWVGCYSDATGDRSLTASSETDYSLTVELCAAFCSTYTFFGVEFGAECYCGNTLVGQSALMLATDCSMVCDGNANEYCGGSNRMDVYKNGGSAPTSSAKPSTTSTTSTKPLTTSTSTSTKPSTTSSTSIKPSTTSTTTSSAPTSTSTGWKYDGCYVDNSNARIIQYAQPDNQQLTVESCISTCAGQQYTVAGVEWGVQCFCGYAIINAGALAPNQGDCSMACGGNSAEICGASSRMSVYHTGQLTVLGLPVVQSGGLGGWTYQGCRTDSVANRTLPWFQVLLNNNTATNCLGLCAQFGYNAGALQWGQECYCGDIADRLASNSVPALETDCGSVCSGNVSELCGGSDRISYYEWTGTPLYTFHYPTGTGMGQYSYVIDAPIVPIISTPGINGKVAFVEKFGTSLTEGSTGAYELDTTTMTWRTMHVESDVFCSASLTLPDKAGRQINVGGWNYDSVWGVRLYWPDGAPGVTSVNDWEENYDELHLQAARWYPTAMIMGNGSILIIGGETTAAGAPSPTLEILPETGGGLIYFEWLDRTDPNNLYPFLAVLPSGGIFVAYYNEARILDPVTFDTIKFLPNMPGAVNNFLSGRTYPVEGTMMLLPQHAPYTDPLIILICGGSAPQNGAGSEALDNCISMSPDDPSPTWTLERMPSRRVMSCMVALPDGTYLILNGAQQGVAGFRLGSRPNLQAVLYDPAQPVGSRMSVMASTTIARMYHSEASLLQDGRVIVTGSDPEDNNYPQEYRVEMFIPPYLLSGAAQPTFTVVDKDWTFGETITISIHLPTGNAAGARVSLIGAASSTHGNSMGQRTIFPTCSCTTTTCTIVAPPNRITPPGWFHLFLLDGPTPSKSVFVRIGGDPAAIGNWPNFSDFSKPGI